MKRKLLLFVILIATLGCLALSACEDPPLYLGEEVIPPPEFLDAVVQYDGTAKAIAVSGLPAGSKVDYTYKKNGAEVKAEDVVELGTYEVTAKITLPPQYNPVRPMTAKLTIEKGVIDTGSVRFESTSAVYSGEAIELDLVNLPDGVDLDYFIFYDADGEEIETIVSAGEYTVEAYLYAEDPAHYRIANGGDVKTTTFTVKKKQLTLKDEVTFTNGSAAYTGSAQFYEKAQFDSKLFDVSYEYSDAMVNVGEYTVTAAFTLKDTDNYELSGSNTVSAKFSVVKKGVYLGVATTFPNGEGKYTGSPLTYENAQYDASMFTVVYTYSEDMINVGSYTVTATFALTEEAARNHTLLGVTKKTATFTVTPKAISVDAAFAPGSAEYDGTAKSHENATGFDADLFDVAYTYSGNMTDAGEYTVTATFILKDTHNYVLEGEATKTTTFTITKKKVSVDASFANGSAVYDGTKQTHSVTDFDQFLLFNIAYSYSGNMIDAGEYTVTATFSLVNPTNYEIEGADTLTATFEITKAPLTLSGVAFPATNSGDFTGLVHTYVLENLPAGVTATYAYTLNGANADLKELGVYDVVATLSSQNYVLSETTITGTYEIKKPVADLSGVIFVDGTLIYDGTSRTYEADKIPEGVTATYVYKQNGVVVTEVKNVGVYTVTVTFASTGYDIAEEDVERTVTFEIVKKKIDLSDVIFSGATYDYDATAKTYTEAIYNTDLFEVSYAVQGNMTDAGTYTVVATFALKDTDNYELEGANTKTATYTIAKKKVSVGATFADHSAEYTGEKMTYEAATGFDADLFTVAYTYSADMVNAGKYTVTATFALKDPANYEIAGSDVATATFIITKKKIVVNAIFDDAWSFYDGTVKSYEAATGFDETLLNVAYSYDRTMLNAGVYAVTATFSPKDFVNYEIDGENTKTAQYKINPIEFALPGTFFKPTIPTTSVYGEPINMPEAMGYPTNVKVTYSFVRGGKSVEKMDVVGEYRVIATFTSKDPNYAVVKEHASIEMEYTITKAPISMENITFGSGSATYSGTAVAWEKAKGYNADLLNVHYTYSGDMTDVGVYTVTATFAPKDSANYKIDGADTVTTTFRIIKAVIDVTKVKFENGAGDYNGSAHKHQVSGLPAGVRVDYTHSGNMTDAGVYKVIAVLTAEDPHNYNLYGEDELSSTFTVNKKKVDLSSVKFPADGISNFADYNGSKQPYETADGYDRTIFNVVYTYALADGTPVAEMINAGDYVVTATFSLKDSDNYVLVGDNYKTTKFTIKQIVVNLDFVVFCERWVNYDGSNKSAVMSVNADSMLRCIDVSAPVFTQNGKVVDPIEVGDYVVSVEFSSNDSNYAIAGADENGKVTLTAVLHINAVAE